MDLDKLKIQLFDVGGRNRERYRKIIDNEVSKGGIVYDFIRDVKVGNEPDFWTDENAQSLDEMNKKNEKIVENLLKLDYDIRGSGSKGGKSYKIKNKGTTIVKNKVGVVYRDLKSKISGKDVLDALSVKRYLEIRGEDRISKIDDVDWEVVRVLTGIYLSQKYGLKNVARNIKKDVGSKVKEGVISARSHVAHGLHELYDLSIGNEYNEIRRGLELRRSERIGNKIVEIYKAAHGPEANVPLDRVYDDLRPIAIEELRLKNRIKSGVNTSVSKAVTMGIKGYELGSRGAHGLYNLGEKGIGKVGSGIDKGIAWAAGKPVVDGKELDKQRWEYLADGVAYGAASIGKGLGGLYNWLFKPEKDGKHGRVYGSFHGLTSAINAAGEGMVRGLYRPREVENPWKNFY